MNWSWNCLLEESYAALVLPFLLHLAPLPDSLPFGLRNLRDLQSLGRSYAAVVAVSHKLHRSVTRCVEQEHCGPSAWLQTLLPCSELSNAQGSSFKSQWDNQLKAMVAGDRLIRNNQRVHLEQFVKSLPYARCTFVPRVLAFTESIDDSARNRIAAAVHSFEDWGDRLGTVVEAADTQDGLGRCAAGKANFVDEDSDHERGSTAARRAVAAASECIASRAIHAELRLDGIDEDDLHNEGQAFWTAGQLCYRGRNVEFPLHPRAPHRLRQAELYVARDRIDSIAVLLAFDSTAEPSAEAFALHGYLVPFWR